MPKISWRKLSWIALNPQNSQKFSPSKVSRYTVFIPRAFSQDHFLRKLALLKITRCMAT